ncbi:MAG: glycosyltransferase family protein [bacterium]
MQNILFYISGHGYGHATRAIEVINALAAKNPNLYFHIKSNAPHWIFELNVKASHSFYPLKTDIGVAQQTSFEIDKLQTLAQWQALYREKPVLVEKEAAFALRNDIKIVIGDIPPLAFDVAEQAGVPSVAIGNFSWDWILSEYIREIPVFADVVAHIQESYRKADLLLRLPMHGDLSVFQNIKDIPLIARRAVEPKSKILKALNIETTPQSILVLVALRATDLAEVDLETAFSDRRYLFITLGFERTFENSLNVAPDFIRFPELVNACDLVVSKPGYGLVSEIVANRTPLLYTSRADFIEYNVLVKWVRKYTVWRFISREHFTAGCWGTHLDLLQKDETAWEHVDLDGAERAAENIGAIFGFKMDSQHGEAARENNSNQDKTM